MPSYDIYFRETIVKRCHIKIDRATDVRAAIIEARATYGHTIPEACLNLESETADIEIFAIDEYAESEQNSSKRSWELDSVSGYTDTPFDIEL